MERFGFILHPFTAKDIARKYSIANQLPDVIIETALKYAPPFKISHISGIESACSQAEGWFVCCPLTARQMLELPEPFVINRIIQAGKVAEKLGARIVGLGAFTSVVGDAGISIAKQLGVAVTSGNSFTVATALEGTQEAAKLMGINFPSANIVVLGATGSIGAACAQLLAVQAKYLTLVARNEQKLDKLASQIFRETGLAVRATANTKAALKNADIVIAVTSAIDTIIDVDDLKPGTIVCDVARPRSVSKAVAEKRDDVLVIEGGVVEVPGDVNFNFNFGFPPKTAYACMAETMILALEGRYENFTLGRDLTIKQIEKISRLAAKHGFKLAGFRSFERAITLEEIRQIRTNAENKKATMLQDGCIA